ncbi:ATP-binding protein [Parafrankia sp. BMG5.11]|uniref:ATP-binding protein n=1 Tax=Parafrankia sp. BMG5.11 TaxID=222540 RepID=UPI0010403A54|nr:ATP-binding protein [Parafrankia sp. BMG5.11]TCJ41262.1 ATP-binding protein [Parafrankia sp. BMG5.11]
MSPVLSDLVKVSRRFTRSVRVDTDVGDPAALEGYICPPSAIDTLHAMARHRMATGHSAFTWTGPYGSGKSSLAVALASLLQGGEAGLAAALGDAGAPREVEELKGHFRPSLDPWRICAVVGQRADPEASIAAAMKAAGGGLPRRAKDEPFAAWVGRAAASIPGPGLALIIDEMGKFLEYAALEYGDIHLFQELAEISSRSGGRLLLVGILHQSFDEYAQRLSRESRDEWLKIQGRYLDLPVNLAADEQIELIARAIEAPSHTAEIDEGTRLVASTMRGGRASDSERLADKLANCWPLHPLTAALLGPISRRRFGQSQRSIFGFLTSAEPFGLQEFLQETAPGERRFGPDQLWDYLRANLEAAILASPDGHRWSTAVDAIDRCERRGGTAAHIAAIKTIALLDLFKDRSGLQPTPEVVMYGVGVSLDRQWSTLSADLINWSVVVFRKHTGSYAIYAGSDFDIEKALDDARAKGVSTDFVRLEEQSALRPILAKRHYEATGALRWFEVGIGPLHEAEERVRSYRPAPGSAGMFLILVSAYGETKVIARRLARAAADQAGENLVMVGWTRDSYRLRELTADLAALEHVRAQQPELEGDAVARREIDARLARLSAELDDRLRDAVDQVDWYGPREDLAVDLGENTGPAGLSLLASRLADWRFSYTPRLHNELVNRTRPSSNAVAATRSLLHAMVEGRGAPKLGLQGYPPEAGLFFSLLEATGLYGKTAAGKVGFVAPPADDPHCLFPVWQAADTALQSSEDVSIADIFGIWRKSPFGVRDGLLPVLGLAYVLTRASHTSLYLDGVFRPQLDTYFVDRMLQDPSAIRARHVELTHHDVSLVAELAGSLGDSDHVAPTPLDVAKAIVGRIRALPSWSQRTAMVSPEAINLRQLGLKSHDPNQLLFNDIPSKFEGEPGVVAGAVAAALTELQTAYPAMLEDLARTLLTELRCDPASDPELKDLHERCENLRGLSGNFRLDALATRLSAFTGEISEIEGIASLAANKPARDWVDRDIDAAKIELAALAQQFLQAEGLAHLKGRGDRQTSVAVYISDPSYPAPASPFVELNDIERKKADALAIEIRRLINESDAGSAVALGAIARLGLSLAKELDDVQQPAQVAA